MLTRILASTAVLFGAAASLGAQQMSAPAADVTITGQVIDLYCYTTKGASGPGHKECALACAKAGVPLAILAKDGTIYLPVSAQPGDPQNGKLIAFVEAKVKVMGTTKFEHGLHTIEIKSVTAAS